MTSAPAIVAILGDGQLGRMMAIEGKRLGYTMWAVGADVDGPAAQVVDRHIPLQLGDSLAIAEALADANIVTFETEHVPAATLRAVATRSRILPDPGTLLTLQDRLTQKQMLQEFGLPVPAFCEVSTAEDFAAAGVRLGFPFVFKTRRGGYDGRGQILVHHAEDVAAGGAALARWQALDHAPGVAEAFVSFVAEMSIVLARDAGGNFRSYPLAENVHSRHVLRTTRAPAAVAADVADRAFEIGRRLSGSLQYVGVMAVETFVLADGQLLINEIAPRVHNSGHFTWGASATSQFEQHIRAICDLPLGDTTTPSPVVMANLLGDLWAAGEPDFSVVSADPAATLHLYGKREARPGRKMGHLVVVDADGARAFERAEGYLQSLERAAGLLKP